jgi:hypothetical protein
MTLVQIRNLVAEAAHTCTKASVSGVRGYMCQDCASKAIQAALTCEETSKLLGLKSLSPERYVAIKECLKDSELASHTQGWAVFYRGHVEELLEEVRWLTHLLINQEGQANREAFEKGRQEGSREHGPF